MKRLVMVICQFDIGYGELKNSENYEMVMVMIIVKAMGMVTMFSDGNGDRWVFLPI